MKPLVYLLAANKKLIFDFWREVFQTHDMVAEGDMVVLAFRRELSDPQNAGKTYTTTWFDMFRIKDGKLAEHWDYGTKAAK